MKTIIVYESTHHGNTKKLVDAIAKKYGVKTVSIEGIGEINFDSYDFIGVASGVAFGKFYAETEKFVAEKLPASKDVFFIYTCGKDSGKYADSVAAKAKAKNCKVAGIYSCPGFDTFGPFKLVGGISKGHPTQSEIEGAVEFYGRLVEGKK